MKRQEEIEKRKKDITEVLAHHKIGIKSIHANIGPSLTLYEVVPEDGVKVTSIRNLEDDIELSLAAEGVRVIAPLPGRGCVGIEVPNEEPDTVFYGDVDQSSAQDKDLPILLGKTVEGSDISIDLTDAPHILMAGATGQGKSVSVNIMIKSLVDNLTPDQVKFLMIDPKRVELSPYRDMKPYLVEPEGVISEMDRASEMLDSVCDEMEKRYTLLEEARVRNIKEYKRKLEEGKIFEETGFRDMPYLVVVIDEFADFIMNSGSDAENKIVRLAQMARAVGIHLIITTQRPSSKVVTGLIKANIPVRISFKVPTNTDSRTVLDEKGAENLMGKGDALLKTSTTTTRFQSAFIDIDEIDKTIENVNYMDYQSFDLSMDTDNNDDEEDAVPCEENSSEFCNEHIARYLNSVEDASSLDIDWERKDGFYVISINDLWFVFYDENKWSHDIGLLKSVLEKKGLDISVESS